MKNYDIIVIGAGPGGSAAAKTAAENGYSTCFFEKESLREGGRYKACGGAIAWELVEEIKYPEEKISRIIESLELHHIDGETFSKNGKGAVVWRSEFDKYVTDLAMEAGAKLNDNEKLINIQKSNGSYQIETNKGQYQAKYVIAADGVTSTTLNLLKWPFFESKDTILTITQEMRTSQEDIKQSLGSDKVHLFFGIKDFITVGYAWLFPKKETITVGWGNQINLIKNSREEFQKFRNLSFVKNALKNSELDVFKPHLIPVGLRSKLYDENVFAVGDVTTLAVTDTISIPKAGVFAEGEAITVAKNIISKIQSNKESLLFDGKGVCFIESGRNTASLIEVDMFSGTKPSTKLTTSTTKHLDEKIQFEKERFTKWL